MSLIPDSTSHFQGTDRTRRFASASGVRSGTQPTVIVAKGKIANCRVLRAISQTASFLGPRKLLLNAQDLLAFRRFPFHF
jgi:hypothetical protein